MRKSLKNKSSFLNHFKAFRGIKLVILLTLLPILLLISFIVTTYFQEKDINVKDIQITNITDGSVTVTFLTSEPSNPYVVVNEFNNFSILNQLNKKFFQDDRFQQDRYTHHITITGLKSSSKYYYRISTGLKNVDTNYPSLETAPVLDTLQVPSPSYGKFESISDDQIVFLTLGSSQVISSVTNVNGTFTLDKSNLRTKDLSSPVSYKDGDTLNFSVISHDKNLKFDSKVGEDQPVKIQLSYLVNPISTSTSLNRSVVDSVKAAATCDRRQYNECCTKVGTSRHVTVTDCDANGNPSAWKVENCIPDTVCTKDKTPTCASDEERIGADCVKKSLQSASSNSSSTSTPPLVQPVNKNFCTDKSENGLYCDGNSLVKCVNQNVDNRKDCGWSSLNNTALGCYIMPPHNSDYCNTDSKVKISSETKDLTQEKQISQAESNANSACTNKSAGKWCGGDNLYNCSGNNTGQFVEDCTSKGLKCIDGGLNTADYCGAPKTVAPVTVKPEVQSIANLKCPDATGKYDNGCICKTLDGYVNPVVGQTVDFPTDSNGYCSFRVTNKCEKLNSISDTYGRPCSTVIDTMNDDDTGLYASYPFCASKTNGRWCDGSNLVQCEGGGSPKGYVAQNCSDTADTCKTGTDGNDDYCTDHSMALDTQDNSDIQCAVDANADGNYSGLRNIGFSSDLTKDIQTPTGDCYSKQTVSISTNADKVCEWVNSGTRTCHSSGTSIGIQKQAGNGTFLPNLLQSVYADANIVTDRLNIAETGIFTIAVKDYTSKVNQVKVYDPNTYKVKFFNDINGNGVQDKGEEYISDPLDIKLEKIEDVKKINLKAGWNLINVNIVNNKFKTAKDLIDQINSQGGYATHVETYRDGKWIILTVRAGSQFGVDFNLVPSEGYFVKVIKPVGLILEGNLIQKNLSLIHI